MREIDQAASLLNSNSQELDEFIAKHDFFILKTASKTAKRYICKEDDEYSVALYAFYDAVNKYDYTKGAFYSFAELIIHRNIVDYYRAKSKFSNEIGIEEIEDNAVIISDNYEEISDAILSRLGRGVTLIDGRGGFSKREKTIIYSVTTRLEIAKLKSIVYEKDPKAFLVMSDVFDIMGGKHKKRSIH